MQASPWHYSVILLCTTLTSYLHRQPGAPSFLPYQATQHEKHEDGAEEEYESSPQHEKHEEGDEEKY